VFNGLSSVVAASRANLNSLSDCLYNFFGVTYSVYLLLNRAALVAIMLVMLVLIAVAFAAALVVDVGSQSINSNLVDVIQTKYKIRGIELALYIYHSILSDHILNDVALVFSTQTQSKATIVILYYLHSL
jgi:hypothetical protein